MPWCKKDWKPLSKSNRFLCPNIYSNFVKGVKVTEEALTFEHLQNNQHFLSYHVKTSLTLSLYDRDVISKDFYRTNKLRKLSWSKQWRKLLLQCHWKWQNTFFEFCLTCDVNLIKLVTNKVWGFKYLTISKCRSLPTLDASVIQTYFNTQIKYLTYSYPPLITFQNITL